MKVLICSPYLDCAFGAGKGTQRSGVIVPIRKHWENFLTRLEAYHRFRGDELMIWEDYMWEFDNPRLTEFKIYDRVYVPHRNHKQYEFHADNVMYYMQTVFPHLFTVDSMGWGGTNSQYPFTIPNKEVPDVYDEYVKRIHNNVSKFDQVDLPWDIPTEGYIFFPCQLPHDETIQYHSNFGVAEALHGLCHWADQNDIKVVVKGHPINPGSMLPLKEIAMRFNNCEWVENVSVHTLMANCKAVYTVNSGTGMEALLHKKPVVVWGQAEYDAVAYRCDGENYDQVWKWVTTTNREVQESKYKEFINYFVDYCVDSTKEITNEISNNSVSTSIHDPS